MAESDKHVLILGCGYTGCVLAQKLAFRGTPVFGTTRSEARASVIRTRGAQPIHYDGTDFEPLRRLFGRVRAVVHAIPPQPGDAELFERFVDWGLDAYIYLSSTSVYGDHGGEVVTEATPCAPDSPRGEARLATERALLATPGLPAMVIRPAGIYGPGRSMLHRVAAGRYRLVDGGRAFTNRIHVADLASMCARAVTRGEAGAIYLGSDEQPAAQAEVAEHIVSTYGLPEPVRMGLDEARIRLTPDVLAMILGSKRLDSSWTREALGVRLAYPDYKQGLARIWTSEEAEIRALTGS